ncbi:MAG: nucleotide sugar dehydrogenase [Sarcina sp.]
MNLYKKIIKKEEKVAVIGLGYVGMPLAVAFAKKVKVVGFDLNKEKINQYMIGKDVTKEVGDEELKKSTVEFTSDENKIKECKFHIVAVPTPINDDKTPNLKPVEGASKIVGRNLGPGSIVVFESTVFPGVTEEICVPILEAESGLQCGKDFFVGYSPERINPGDKVHRLETIVKIVSGQNEQTLENIANLYELIVEAGVHRAESIKVAEAAKVIENSQRDINIAFTNELSIIFNKMGIDTQAVLKAARTKWNFLDFKPGLVGGHCIGVDPYYLTYKAEQLGYHSQIILSGRRINDEMGKYIAENTIKSLIKVNKQVQGANVAILGVTFKENCPDTRNSKVVDIVNELKEYGVNILITDPIANKEEVKVEYNLELLQYSEIKEIDALILAVPHKEYLEMGIKGIEGLFINEKEENTNNSKKIIIDAKGILERKNIELLGYKYWRL